MKKLPCLVCLVCFLPVIGFAAKSFENNWWKEDSPELVLSNAQSVTRNLAFFHAEKSGSMFSKITNPFAKTNSNSRVEFFQRKNTDGTVETKEFILDGSFRWTHYMLKSGNYIFTRGIVIKMEYPDDNDEDSTNTVENAAAIKFHHPYEYKLLESETVGTNDCIVIARCMTPKFLDEIKAIYYQGDTKEQEAALGGDFRKFIRSETDYYIRKSDAVIVGEIRRNFQGEQLEDQLYDNIEVNQPIPDQEFSLPEVKIVTAKSEAESEKLAAATRTQTAKTLDPAEKQISQLPWAAGLSKALEQARSQNKIVLLDFTGSDWCVWCRKFDDDVLSKPQFAAYAKTNLVMVLLDFPQNKKQSDTLKKTNADLQAKFKVDAFPTYVALNPEGQEIGRQVGYLEGGPQAFVDELEKFREQKSNF